jgi:ubiquinone/menaquinone biosynthesis C-methylase UbiE
VVGVDIDEVKLRNAREEAAAARVADVEHRLASVDHLPADDPFDLVFARFLLTHVVDRRRRCAA